jgi:hypothetical protein
VDLGALDAPDVGGGQIRSHALLVCVVSQSTVAPPNSDAPAQKNLQANVAAAIAVAPAMKI